MKSINFHENCFISEMSDFPQKRSYKSNLKTKLSIKQRLDLFKGHDFFQQFPIVILACNDYIKGKELCETFNVSYFLSKNDPKWTEKNGFRFWVHYDTELNPQKMVIHTRQFSDFRVEKSGNRLKQEDEFIENIATICKNFLKNKAML